MIIAKESCPDVECDCNKIGYKSCRFDERTTNISKSAAMSGSIPLHDVANKVCKHIPKDFILHLCMENGAAWVSLTYNRNGCKVIDIDGSDQNLYEQINEALCVANGSGIERP